MHEAQAVVRDHLGPRVTPCRQRVGPGMRSRDLVGVAAEGDRVAEDDAAHDGRERARPGDDQELVGQTHALRDPPQHDEGARLLVTGQRSQVGIAEAVRHPGCRGGGGQARLPLPLPIWRSQTGIIRYPRSTQSTPRSSSSRSDDPNQPPARLPCPGRDGCARSRSRRGRLRRHARPRGGRDARPRARRRTRRPDRACTPRGRGSRDRRPRSSPESRARLRASYASCHASRSAKARPRSSRSSASGTRQLSTRKPRKALGRGRSGQVEARVERVGVEHLGAGCLDPVGDAVAEHVRRLRGRAGLGGAGLGVREHLDHQLGDLVELVVRRSRGW